MRNGLIAATIVALVVGGSALLLAKDDPAAGGTQAQSGGFEKVTKVEIKDFKYLPPSDEVKVGQSIKFTNQDTAKHTATSQPQGTFDSRCCTSASMALSGSSPGASRRLTFARAMGTRMLPASLTFGASMPSTETAEMKEMKPLLRPARPARV